MLLLDMGLAVFPLPAGGKCADPGWQRRVTTDLAVIAGWPAAANIGVGCRASGIVALDLDVKGDVDGVATFRELCAFHRQPRPDTFTVATPHGLHLYFRAPADAVVPSVIGRWPGIDVRAPGLRLGGYLVGPGSVVDGRSYMISRKIGLTLLPHWLTRSLSRR